MTKTQRLLSFTLGGLCLLLLSSAAQAIPAFARQEGVKCSSCHTAWPQLNARGRAFKENGYRFPEDADEARSLNDVLEDGLPAAVLLAARPYDKKKSGDKKNRALHEFELFVAGALNAHWSGYAEIEAEDETGFSPEVAAAAAAYRFSKALNLNLAWSDYFRTDAYGLLGDGFRMTRGHVRAIDSAFGGNDGGSGLRGTRQLVSLSGRPLDPLFYDIGWSATAGDAEGEDASNVHVRVAFDVLPNVMLGGFHINGENASKLGFSRTGVDLQADALGGRLQAAYVRASDDRAGGGSEDNNALSVQGMYFLRKGSRPTWVPVVRYDTYEVNNGKDSYDELTLNLTRYFAENVKGYVEYWKQLDVPGGKPKDDRVTVQVSVAF